MQVKIFFVLFSLLTLSRVIVALGTPNQAHINFRDSKLTRILQPSLSGNARMAVICCATPSELYLEETRSTLQFASRAKLVKTNAQVNEILDDRSIIRRLQRELAEARRQSNVPGTEHLQALENQAATADTVALEAKAKLHRLKESILNAGYLFGNQNTAEVSSPGLDVSEAVDRLHESKKRRQSDGALFLGNTSPSKPDCYMATTPNTAPRKRKQKVPRQILSPSSELQIVREALSSRNNLTRTLERSVNEYIDILKAKDTELQKEVSQNESLQQERGESQILVSSLRQMIESIQSEFSKAMQAHERVLEEKESVINDSLQKLENGFREREKLSNANTNMEVQLLSARQENLSQVETSTALTNNLENLASENTVLKNGVDKSIVLISKLKGEKNALEEQLSTMSEKAEAFESINGQLTANKVGLEQSLAELLNKNEVSNGENARLNRRVSQLEGVMTELNRQWLAEKEKTAALVESTENFAKALAILKDEKNALGIEVEAAREELMRSKSEAENMALEASKLGNEAAATSVRLKEVEENADFLRKEKKACEAATAELRVDLETRETEFFGVSNSLKEARICITELEENNADLQQHITSLEKQIINLQAKKEAMSAESIKTSQELHSFRIEASEGLEAASREKTELEATVSILEQANYELTLRRQELEETNISLQAENIDVDGRLFALEANKSQLDSQLVTVESEIVLLLEEKDSQMSRLTDMQQQVTVLEEVRENMNSQMAELIVEKDSMILESETSYQNVQSSLKQVSKDLEMLRLEKVELEARLSELQEANGELTSSRQELQETLTSLQVENADVRDRLSAYVVEKAELDSQIMYIKSEVMEAVAEKDSKVVNLEAKLSDLQAENADVNDRLSTLQVEKAEIGSHLMSVKTEAIAMLATSDSRTATLSDMQQQVAVLEDQLADTEERIDSLHSEKESSSNKTKLQLEEAKGELSSLEAQKRELEIKLSSLDSCHQEIERSVLALQAENEDILVRLSTSEDERAGLEGQLEHLNFEFEELRAKNNSTEGGRQEFQNQLEMAERHLQQAEVDLQHAISQRESLTEILRERENERDDAMLELEKQYEKNRHLSRSFSDCLPKEKEAELISQISELKKTKSELTQLLVLSNESEVRSRNAAAAAENESNVKARELDDAMYRLSQVEEELRLSEMTDYDEKKTTEANSDFLDKIKLIEAEKAKVEDLLAKEKGESRSSEERLKKQMGEEQRILIKEAESRMLQLRSKCEDLESRLSQSETEAYVARQQVEEVRDQKKLVEERYLEVESTVASLNETISRHESQFSVLQSDLNKARAECYALKESTIEMKEKARRAMRESDKAARDSNMVSSEISVLRRKITSLERSNTQEREDNERLKMKIKTMKAEKTKAEEEHGAVADLKKEKESKNKQIKKLDESIYTLKQENETISRELRKLKSAIRTKGDTDGSAIEIGVLQGEIDRLIKQMKQKDQRIRKLEAVRLTKEQVESIKKMKVSMHEFGLKVFLLTARKLQI